MPPEDEGRPPSAASVPQTPLEPEGARAGAPGAPAADDPPRDISRCMYINRIIVLNYFKLNLFACLKLLSDFVFV